MNKPFVLVVEDDNAVRNLIATTLETHDYKYHKRENKQLLKLLHKNRI